MNKNVGKGISTLSRYIPNKLKNSLEVNESNILSQCKERLELILKDQLSNYPPNSKYKVYSSGKIKKDYSVYTGTGGNMYIYWRYLKLAQKNNLADKELDFALSNLMEAYKLNIGLVEELISSDGFNIYDQSSAFFHGPVGIYTMGCITANVLNNSEWFENNLEEVLKYKDSALSKYSEDELLYGNAGYLYSLLLIYKHCIIQGDYNTSNDNLTERLISAIKEVTEFMYKTGIEQQKKHQSEFIIFPFPRYEEKGKASKIYFGGAHGVIGVLFQILSAINILGGMEEIKESLQSHLLSLTKIQLQSGNFPSSLTSISKDELVQFCHGATGAIHLFALAYEIYQDQIFYDTAEKCGHVLWERGILTKGNGICHGITGNVYALYKVYQLTKSDEWKNKFLTFASFTFDLEVQNLCKNFDDPRRIKKGTSDTPYSLMEGQGGDICLYSDILSGEILFPGYEV